MSGQFKSNSTLRKKIGSYVGFSALLGGTLMSFGTMPAANAAASCPEGSVSLGDGICEVSFTSGTGTFTAPAGITDLEVLLVGAGGHSNYGYAGGGGEVKVITLDPADSTFTYSVGAGAAAEGASGRNSTVSFGTTTESAVGGHDGTYFSGGASGNNNLGGNGDWAASGGGAGGAGDSLSLNGGAGTTPDAVSGAGSIFKGDFECFGGGGAGADATGVIAGDFVYGYATCGGGYLSEDKPTLTIQWPIPNSGGGGAGPSFRFEGYYGIDGSNLDSFNRVGADGFIAFDFRAPGITLSVDNPSISKGETTTFTTNASPDQLAALFIDGVLVNMGPTGALGYAPWEAVGGCDQHVVTVRIYDETLVFDGPLPAPKLFSDTYAATVDVTFEADPGSCLTLSSDIQTYTQGGTAPVFTATAPDANLAAIFINDVYFGSGPFIGQGLNFEQMLNYPGVLDQYFVCGATTKLTLRLYDRTTNFTEEELLVPLDVLYSNTLDISLVGAACPITAFTVHFDNRGHGSSVADATEVTTIAHASLPGNSQAGYTFLGWSETSDGAVITGDYSPTAESTLYAQWSANSLTVTYDSQGGTSVAQGSTVTDGSIATSPGVPSLGGNSFLGWFSETSGGSAITFPYTHERTEDFTLYAHWAPVPPAVFAITFDSQGGSAVPSSTSFAGGTAYMPTAPTRAGYTFVGWFTTASGGSAITFPYSHGRGWDFTLYAQWAQVPPPPPPAPTAPTDLTVSFDSQGGSSVSAGSTVSGGSIAQAPAAPTKAGYTFTGWSTSATGGGAITFPYVHGQSSNFTLFAQWSEDVVPTAPMINIKAKFYFDMGSSKITASTLAKIKALALRLAPLGKTITITSTGFAQPTKGTEKSDLKLSTDRAVAVAKALRSFGVTVKITTAGGGRAANNVASSRYVEVIAAN